jgi:hypothetical protein
VAGWSFSNDGDVTGHHGGYADYWIVKLSSMGDLQWQKSLGGSYDDDAYSIQQTRDQGYIVAGYSYSSDGDVMGHHGSLGNYDYWIMKLSDTGAIEWQKSLGGSDLDWAASIQETSDGGYIVAGQSRSIDGDVSGKHGGEDYWIVKLAPPPDLSVSYFMAGKDLLSIQNIVPNPTSSDISIELHIPANYQNDGNLEIYSVLGNLEQKLPLIFDAFSPSKNISLSLKGNGVHFIRAISALGVITKIVVVEK